MEAAWVYFFERVKKRPAAFYEKCIARLLQQDVFEPSDLATLDVNLLVQLITTGDNPATAGEAAFLQECVEVAKHDMGSERVKKPPNAPDAVAEMQREQDISDARSISHENVQHCHALPCIPECTIPDEHTEQGSREDPTTAIGIEIAELFRQQNLPVDVAHRLTDPSGPYAYTDVTKLVKYVKFDDLRGAG